MKIIYLIRHAKSSWEFDLDDEQRPLTSGGIEDAEAMGIALQKHIPSVDIVLSSPAKRAFETAEIIVNHLPVDNELLNIHPDLYDFNGTMVLEVIKSQDDTADAMLIFGHNHAFTSLVNKLGNKSIDNLPTAGAVGIKFKVKSWKDIDQGKTVFNLFPKSL